MKLNLVESFEEITEGRIGFGKYQYILLSLLGIIFLADGLEMSCLSIIFPILKVEWNISESLQGLLGSVMFIGFFFGSLISAFITDKIGRKLILVYSSLIQFIIGIVSITINNVYFFLIIRGIFGFLLGFQMPLIPILCTELIPMDKRAKGTVIINTLFSVGQFFAAVIAYFCLDNLHSGNWRLLLFLCSCPPLAVWFGVRKYMKESPMFVILKENVESGIIILNHMGKINTEKFPFSTCDRNFKEFKEEECNKLKQWKDHVTSKHDNSGVDNFIATFKVLLQEKNNYRRITLGMWASWFGVTFMFYGILFILPLFFNEIDNKRQIEKKSAEGISSLMIATLGEGSSGILAYFLVDTETFGRKFSLAFAQLVSSTCILLAYTIDSSHIIILVTLLTIARFFAKMCFAVLYPLSAELYPTNLRTIGVGLSSAVGRIAGTIMPLIAIRLFYIDIYSPFLLFFAIGIIGLCGTLSLPYDTRGRHLDMHSNRNSLNKNINNL